MAGTAVSAAGGQANKSNGGSSSMQAGISHAEMRQMQSMFTFHQCEELLRGVPLAKVLAGASSILQNSGGSQLTYAASRPVQILEAFLSHNWSTPRWMKHLALVLHFGFDVGTAVSVVALICLSVLASQGVGVIGRDPGGYPLCILSRIVFTPLSIAVFCVHREILGRVGFGGPHVFLDKICINQGDELEMRRGIEKLGAFIRLSKRMTVLYNEQYLTKIWTVYEVATFLAFKPVEDMDVVPVTHSVFFFKALGTGYVFSLLWIAALQASQVLSVAVLSAAGMFTLFFYMRSSCAWYTACAKTQKDLNTFSIRRCTCAVEADRPVVYANIVLLMRAQGLISNDAAVDDGLDAFDGVVRTTLPVAFAFAFGSRMFAYKHYVFICLTISGTVCADLLSYVSAGFSAREIFVWAAQYVTWVFCLFPCLLFFAEIAGRRSASVGSLRQRLVYQVVPSVLGMVICAVGQQVSVIVGYLAISSDVALSLVIVCSVLSPAAGWAAYSGACPRRCRPRPAAPAEASGGVPVTPLGRDLGSFDGAFLDTDVPLEASQASPAEDTAADLEAGVAAVEATSSEASPAEDAAADLEAGVAAVEATSSEGSSTCRSLRSV